MHTEKLYYQDAYMKEFDARVLSCESKGTQLCVVLDRTAFYPEGGGQPADHGRIGGLEVFDVHEKDGVILHSCRLPLSGEGDPAAGAEQTAEALLSLPGSTVHCVPDWDRRFDHMQQHSGEHITSGMLCSRFHCDNVGFHMGADFVTIDYNAEIRESELPEVEEAVNRYLWEAHPFIELWPAAEELERLEYRSKKALTGAVRITEFPGADRCACCGTHVRNSSEVGLVKLFSAQKFRGGTRIQMMSGGRALRYLSACHEQNLICSRETSSKPLETGEGVRLLKQEYLALRGRAIGLENECFARIAQELESVPSPVYFTGPLPSESVKKLCVGIAEKAQGRVCVFAGEGTAWKYALIEAGAELLPFVKELNAALSGRGGGRGGFAQGSLAVSRKEIESFLNRRTEGLS